MKRFTFCLAIFFLAFLLAESTYAQSFYRGKRQRNNIASFGVGLSSYYGDLNNPGDIIDTKLDLSLGLQHVFGPRFNVRGEIAWFQLTGDDKEANDDGRTERNLSFTSSNVEANVVAMFYAFPNGSRFYQRRTVNFYGFVGFGVLYFNPKGELDGEKYALRPLQTEGVEYSPIAFSVPYGGGVKVKLNAFLDAAIEINMRTAFTDRLDDVSENYVGSDYFDELFTDPEEASRAQLLADKRWEIGLPPLEAGRQRGNPKDNDSYMVLSLRLEYYLPSSFLSKKYKQRRPKRYRRAKRR